MRRVVILAAIVAVAAACVGPSGAPGVVVTSFAGNAGVQGSADGTGPAASFGFPRGVAADSSNNLYVADTINSTIRKITPTGEVTTLAGTAGVQGSADGTGPAASFQLPDGLAVDSSNNIYVADTGNSTIRKITPAGEVTTLAGTAGVQGWADGTGPAASFYGPAGVAVDSSNNVYVADTGNNTIRKITPAGWVGTFAGAAGVQGWADGAWPAARFRDPFGVAVDSSNNVYVADTINNTIRKITPAGEVTTLAGTAGVQGSADGTGATASFHFPSGVAVDSSNNIYVADTGNHTIREIPTPASLQISTTPALFPDFSTSVTDYVSRCTASSPVTVSVTAPADTTVSVAGQPASGGTFTANVTRDVGQSFTIVVQASSQPPSTYYVRCLPSDFPTWTAQRSGTTQAEYYITVPLPFVGTWKPYPVIFDSNGVPLWWGATGNASFATLLPDGNVAWTNSSGAEEHALDGSLVRTIKPTVGSMDIHDLLLLPNGDYVIVADTVRSGVDLSGLCVATVCGPSSTSVLDMVIQELKPDGTLVWSWDTADHIPASELDLPWYGPIVVLGSSPYDIYHWNSIEYTGSGFILSFRHEDAIYDIDQTTGNVLWKLGGTPRPESLAISNDPVFPDSGFGGQHDARLLSDGTLTLHDNGTLRSRPPRAVRYQLDTTTTPGTATLVEQQSDPLISSSFCCGSARKLPGGDWVMGWGSTNTDTEMTADGNRVFLLKFQAGTLIYRSAPVPYGRLNRAALRAGMDAQYSPTGVAHATPPTQPGKAPEF